MKKILALLLVAAMLLPPTEAMAWTDPQAKEPPVAEEHGRPEQLLGSDMEKIEFEAPYSDDEVVTAIIELEAPNPSVSLQSVQLMERMQDSVEQQISAMVLGGEELEISRHYTEVLNGFAAEVPYGTLDEIRALDDVARVYVAPTFKVAPDMPTSTTVLGGMENGSGYKGEGMVIAIVDSGLELTHPAFAAAPNSPALDQAAVAQVLESQTLKAEQVYSVSGQLTASMVYHGGKVPFAFDYADRDTDVTPGRAGDHGTHVAGIASANSGVTADVVGVAPEAQLLAMKVFSSYGNGLATWDSILAAMDDAVALGADVINLSLGSTCGFADYSWEEGVADTLNRVVEAGVSLSVACGNEYSAAFYNRLGKGHALTSNPDYGTAASPAVYGPSLAVASVEKEAYALSSYLMVGERKVAYNDITEAANMDIPAAAPSLKSLGTGKALEYVVIPGVGEPSDYEGLNVTGKIALVSRGTTSYESKKNAAKQAGAAALLVWNNEPGMSYMQMDTYDLPAAFLCQTDGKALAAMPEAERKLTIAAEKENIKNPASGLMSDFSSWGVTPELTLKPDITAPGGNIKSTVTNGGYGVKSGTSMAAPFVSGALAVTRQYVQQEHPAADGRTEAAVADALLMSTAVPVLIDGAPYSPRKQGAGLINVDQAVASPAYLTVDGGRPKVALGDDTAKNGVYTMSFEIHNWSDAPVTYTLGGTVQTDATEVTKQIKGQDVHQVTELPHMLDAQIGAQTITVDAGAAKTVTVTVTLTAGDKAYLDKNFANGSYVEGFLTLTPAGGGVTLSLPYMGFYGDWTRASVIDRGYFWNDLKDEANWAAQYTNTAASTSLESTVDTYLGDNPYHRGVEYLQDRSAISPNGDDYMDKLDILYTGLLRNVATLKYTIANANDPADIYYEQEMDHVTKSVYSGGYFRIVPAGVDDYTKLVPWDGKDHGISLPNDSKVLVTVTATLPYDKHAVNNECLSWSFPLTIDTEEPSIENVKVREENGKFFVDLTVHDNQYVSNIAFANATGDKLLQSFPVAEPEAGMTTELSFDVTGMGQKLTLVVNDYASNRRETGVQVDGNVDESQVIVPTRTVMEEDFETETFPANGWTLESHSAKTWYQGVEYGSRMACCAVSSTEQQNEWLITPAIDLSAQETKAGIVFDFYANYFWNVEQHCSNLKVKASTNGRDWEDIWQLWDVKKEFGPWEKTQAKVIIPQKFQNAANVQFAFVYEGMDSTETYIDNVQVYVEDPSMIHTITAVAGEGGTIAPEGAVKISDGMNRTFTVTPNEGYIIADVKVDGTSVGPRDSYTFEKVTADHTIEAVFSAREGGNTAILVDEDFEGQTMPTGWTRSGINDQYTWKTSKYWGHWGAYSGVDTYDPDPGYNQPGNPQDEYLILPVQNLNGREEATLSFQFSANKRELGAGNMTATVEITTDGKTWTPLWNGRDHVDSLKEDVISSYVGTADQAVQIPAQYLVDGVQIAFRYQHPKQSSDGGPVFVDNVKLLVTGGGTAPEPQPPAADEVLLNEDFEKQTMPDGWTLGKTNAETWQVKKSFQHWTAYCSADMYEEDPWGGGWSLKKGAEPMGDGFQDERLITPALNLNGRTGTLSFQFSANKGCLTRDEMTVTVEATSDDGKTWTPLWNAKDTLDSMKEGVFNSYIGTGDIVLDIPAEFQKDGVKFAFRYQHPRLSADGGPVYVDDVKVVAKGGGETPEPPAPPVSSDLINQDFESMTPGDTMPDGWTVDRTNAASTWKIYKYAGSMTAYVSDDWKNYAKQDERLLTPAVDLSGGGATVSFRFVGGKYPIQSNDFTLTLEGRTAGGSWQQLWSSAEETGYTADGDYRLAAEVSLEVPADLQKADAQFAFRYVRPAGESTAPCSVDNVKVTAKGGGETPEPPATEFVIKASAGQGGSITPYGEVSVTRGDGQIFVITASEGYKIADVVVDGVSQGKITNYFFENVEKNHTIEASFAKIPEVLPAEIHEDFNNGLPEKWLVEGPSASGHYETWKNVRLRELNTTNAMVCTQNFMNAKQNEHLILPETQMAEGMALTFDWAAKQDRLSTGEVELTVQASLNKGGTWTTLWDASEHLPSVPAEELPEYVTGTETLRIPADFCVPGARFAFVFTSYTRGDGAAAIDNVTLAAGDTPAPALYAITVAQLAHGTVTPSKTIAAEGETITLTVVPETGYQLKAGSLVAGDTVVEGSTFTMPGKAVEITALFEKIPVIPETPAYKDGVYEGQAEGRNGAVRVKVTVTAGAIAKVEVLEHQESPEYWPLAEKTLTDLQGKTSREGIDAVDTRTGATISSNAIKAATLDALSKAVENESGIFASGKGTESDPWIINTAEQLTAFADSVNKGESYRGSFIALNSDLDLSEVSWKPIGTSDHEKYTGFSGTFDGRNHTVSHVNIGSRDVPATYEALGFFGVIDGGLVRNLNVKVDLYFNNVPSSAPVDHVWMGGLAGILARNGAVEHCTVTSAEQMSISDTSGRDGAMGGLVGKMNAGSVIANCWTNANLSYGSGSFSAVDAAMGGICGLQGQNSLIANSASFGIVPGTALMGVLRIGGLVGHTSGSLYNCYTTSTTKANIMLGEDPSKPAEAATTIGHLIGSSTAETVLYQCYYNKEAKQFSNTDMAADPAEGKPERRQAVGWDPVSKVEIDIAHVTACTPAELTRAAFADTMNEGLKTLTIQAADTYFGGKQVAEAQTRAGGFDRWELRNTVVLPADTQDLAISVADTPILEDIIVSVGTPLEKLNLPETISVTLNTGLTAEVGVEWITEGYTPDVATTYKFMGTLILPEGITNPNHYTARITVMVQADAPAVYEITVAQLTNGTVTADKSSAKAGETVNLTVKPFAGYQLQIGSLKVNGKVIPGTSFRMPAEDVTITAVFEEVSAPPAGAVYEDGVYEGEAQGRGGLVKVKVTVTGGAVAHIDVVSQSETPEYWPLAERTLTDLLGKTSKESIDAVDTHTGATISSNAIKAATLDALTKAEPSGSGIFASGEGTRENPYIINTVKQLTAFAASVNKGENYKGQYIALNADLDLSELVWVPIGISDHEKYTGFAGTFDGRNHIVRNLTCGTGKSTVSYEAIGFFGVIENGGEVRNLNLQIEKYYNACTLVTDNVYAGGLVGILDRNATVDHCTVSGADQAIMESSGINGAVGAIAGKMGSGSVIANCWTDVGLSYGTYNPNPLDISMGGICGLQEKDSLIANCTSRGSVAGMVFDGALRIGGLAGRTSGAIYNCYTTSLTKANTFSDPSTAVGHLVGCSDTGAALYQCYYDKNAPQVSNVDLAGEPAEGKPERRQAAGWDAETRIKTDLTHVTACSQADMVTDAFAETMNSGLTAQTIGLADAYFAEKQLLSSLTVAKAENALHTGFWNWKLSGSLVLPETSGEQLIFVDDVAIQQDIEVPFGTAETELNLPETVRVTLSNGTTMQAEVVWTCEGYHGDIAARYTFRGALVLPENISNPNNLGARLVVTVRGAETDADKAAAAAVEEKINAIGETITLDSEPAILEARTAYDSLTDLQKSLVKNLFVLKDAEAKLAKLKDEAEKPDGPSGPVGPGRPSVPEKDNEIQVDVSRKDLEEAQKAQRPVELPMDPVNAEKNSADAPEIHVDVPGREPVEITIPVKHPTPGTVAVIVRPDGTEEVVRKCTGSRKGVTLTVTGDTVLKIVDKTRSFSDVPAGFWAEDEIAFVTARGIYNGTTATTFTPNAGMTRGMLAKVLHNLEGNPAAAADAAFSDVPAGFWCGEAIAWAAEQGIVGGYADGTYRADKIITREQLVTMLYRYAGSPAVTGTELNYPDAGQVSSFAEDAMLWAVENGILTGTAQGTLDPQGTATRAQVAAILMRFLNR